MITIVGLPTKITAKGPRLRKLRVQRALMQKMIRCCLEAQGNANGRLGIYFEVFVLCEHLVIEFWLYRLELHLRMTSGSLSGWMRRSVCCLRWPLKSIQTCGGSMERSKHCSPCLDSCLEPCKCAKIRWDRYQKIRKMCASSDCGGGSVYVFII